MSTSTTTFASHSSATGDSSSFSQNWHSNRALLPLPDDSDAKNEDDHQEMVSRCLHSLPTSIVHGHREREREKVASTIITTSSSSSSASSSIDPLK